MKTRKQIEDAIRDSVREKTSRIMGNLGPEGIEAVRTQKNWTRKYWFGDTSAIKEAGVDWLAGGFYQYVIQNMVSGLGVGHGGSRAASYGYVVGALYLRSLMDQDATIREFALMICAAYKVVAGVEDGELTNPKYELEQELFQILTGE